MCEIRLKSHRGSVVELCLPSVMMHFYDDKQKLGVPLGAELVHS